MNKKLLMIAAACLAQAAAAQDLRSGYTCCNLHYDKDKISDANWTHAAMIPAGATIKVLSWGPSEAAVEIDGKPFRIAHEYGKKEESLQSFVSKLVVKSSPRSKVERWPQAVRSAVEAGKVVPGMTREQVIVALSYPPTHKTPSLDARVWQHWQSRAGRFEIHWGADGKVERTNGMKDRP